MGTRNFLINRDSSVITNLSLGNTVDQHHPVGKHATSGNIYRVYMRFTMDFTGMTSILGANLWMRSCPTTHIAKGSSPTVRVKKLTGTLGNTQGGSSEGTWSGSAVPDVAQGVTSTDQSAATNMTGSASVWDAVDITAMVAAWFAGGTHFGLEVRAESEASNADAWEFFSMDSGSDPYIAVTYGEGSDTFARRSGIWVKANPVGVRRGGVWVDPGGNVFVRRGGVWVPA